MLSTLAGYAQITGTVFRDYNGNGTRQTSSPNELGVAGIVVTAYRTTGAPVSVTTAANGTYAFTAAQLPSGTAVRLDFSGLATSDFSGPVATAAGGSGSPIQFVTAGTAAINVNYGINYPRDYCQPNPNLIVPCFVSGNPFATGSTVATEEVLVQVAYNVSGTTPAPTKLAFANQIGSVWGTAYQRSTKKLFSAAFLKRHSELGQVGLGGIYVTNVTTTPTSSSYANLLTLGVANLGTAALGTRNLPASGTTSSSDPTAFSLVGKAGLGDMALSDDESKLYVVDLFNRQLIVMNIGNPAKASLTAADVQTVPIPAPSCTDGVARPFGITVYKGKAYVGVVCTGENNFTTSKANLKAYVYTMDVATQTFNTTPIITIPLNYPKGDVHHTYPALGDVWNPWTDDFTKFNTNNVAAFATRTALPQAILSDIAFADNGDMLLAFMDRAGHQLGYRQRKPSDNAATATELFSGYVGGDLLRTRFDGTQWILENNGKIGTPASGTLTSASGVGNGQGPGGGEFYAKEEYLNASTHQETIEGGITVLPGTNQVVATVMDPLDVFSGGFSWFSNTDGDDDKRYQIFISNSAGDVTLGKANGLGVISVGCNPAPVEIGNRIWNDLNDNGVQDPGEPGLGGIPVVLRGPNNFSATVTTNANGNYYFTDAAGTNVTGFNYGLTLTNGANYTLTFPTSASALSLSTKPNSATGANADEIDTDPNAGGVITFTLGGEGQNDFSFDAAFVSPPCGLTLALTPGLCLSATNSYALSGTVTASSVPASGTLTISSGAFTPRSLTLAAGNSSSPFNYTGLVSNGQAYTVTASYSNSACAPVSQTYTAPVSCSLGLSVVVATPVCNTLTNNYTATGTVSLTNTPAGSLTITNNGITTAVVAVTAGQATASFSLTGVSGSLPPSHTVVASLGTAAASTTYATPASCTVCSLSITTASLPAGQVGTAYSQTIQTTGGTAPVTFTISVGSLPTGLTLNPTTGTISGTPIAQGTSSFTIRVTDAKSCSAIVPLSITTSAVPVCSLTATATPGSCSTATNQYAVTGSVSSTNAALNNASPQTLTILVGSVSTTVILTGDGPVSYTIAGLNSDGLVRTLTVMSSASVCGMTSLTYTAPASCTIAPPALAVVVATPVCNTLTNTYTSTGTVSLTNVTPGTITITDNGTTAATVSVTAGQTSATFSLTGVSGSLPPTHTVVATLTGGTSASTTYATPASCTVCSLSITTASLPAGQVGTAYSQTLAATGGTAPLAYAVTGGTLPAGLSLNPTTGEILGTPTASGTASFTVQVTDAKSCSAIVPLTILTSNAPVCSLTATATPGVCNTATNTYAVTGIVSATNTTGNQSLTVSVGNASTVVTLTGNGPTSYTLAGLNSDGAAKTVTVLSSATACGTTSATYTAPVACTVAPPLTAALGDFVFEDTNKNGQQDTGEPGIPNVTVTLLSGTTVVGTTATNGSGLYSFTGLTPGTPYSVSFTAPTGYTATGQNIGNDATDSDGDATGLTGVYSLTAGEFNPTIDMGYFTAPASTSLTINKLVSSTRATLGDVLTYTVVLTNTGTTTAANVTVRDESTTGLTYVPGSVSAPVGTIFTPGTPTSTWSVPSIAAGQSLSLTFQAKADSSGILYNTATIPGDTARVCTTIPVMVCTGDTYLFRLTAAPGRSSYRWFKNDVEIVGQTTNVLDVTAPGTYSLAVDNVTGQCPDFSCCPFIVEENPLPTFTALATPATCVGSTPQANGSITLSQFTPGNTYQYSLGTEFNQAASLSGPAQVIPAGGVIVSTLASPVSAAAYTVRVYNASGCYTDVTVILTPTVCNCPPEVCVPLVIKQTKGARR